MGSREHEQDVIQERTRQMVAYYSEEQWQNAIDRATLFAQKMMSLYSGVSDIEPEHLANDAVSKLLFAKRKWEPTKRTLLNHLIHIIRSDYSHFVEKDNKNSSIDDIDFKNSNHFPVENPEDRLADQQEIKAIKIVVENTGDHVLMGIIDAFEQGYMHYQNAEIAKHIGVDIKDIVNGKKRLNRILDSKECPVKEGVK